jgi:phosphate-selective porin
MRRLSAALLLAALAAATPAAAETGPVFTLLSDGAALSFALAALAMVATLAAAMQLALRGPRR